MRDASGFVDDFWTAWIAELEAGVSQRDAMEHLILERDRQHRRNEHPVLTDKDIEDAERLRVVGEVATDLAADMHAIETRPFVPSARPSGSAMAQAVQEVNIEVRSHEASCSGAPCNHFIPSARQLDLMEHAVGGDSRHRNRFLAVGDDIAPWRELVGAGLAFEDPAFGQGEMVSFHVSPAGLALLDARARPRIIEAKAKAKAWDTFKAGARELLERVTADTAMPDQVDKFIAFVDGWVAGDIPAAPTPKGLVAIAEAKAAAWDAFRLLLHEFGEDPDPRFVLTFAGEFIGSWEHANERDTPPPKGPRELAEEIVCQVVMADPIDTAGPGGSHAVRLAQGGHPQAREHVTACIAEIIRKALGPA